MNGNLLHLSQIFRVLTITKHKMEQRERSDNKETERKLYVSQLL